MRSEERYSRQVRFAPLGVAGQEQLGGAHAVIVGCGALGSVSAELLARAGVGRLTLVDRDYVEFSNLQRQFLYSEADAEDGTPKAIAAQRRLSAVNRDVVVEGVVDDLRAGNAEELLNRAQVVIDASDNFEARFLINDYAVKHHVPWIYGAAVGSYGLSMPILPGRTACFRCVYPEPPSGLQQTCETAGVLGTLTALIASVQATAAIQILSGHMESVRARITTVDVWDGPLREIHQPERQSGCPCCRLREFSWLDGEREVPISLCGQNAVQIHSRRQAIDLRELGTRLASAGEVRVNEFALRFFPSPFQVTVFADGRAIIKGTTDIGVARSVYARWIGAE